MCNLSFRLHINGKSLKVWRYRETDGGLTTVAPLNDTVRPMTGREYLLRVQRKPDMLNTGTWQILPGWTTSLTWLHGKPYAEENCQVDLKETQEVGNDEIYMAIDVGSTTSISNQWLPNAMYMAPGGGGDAKDGAKIGSVDEDGVFDWTGPYFDHAGSHSDGTPFSKLRAIGSASGNLSLAFCEDDATYDECDQVGITLAELPRIPRFKSKGGKKLDFSGDGNYKFMPCAMSHALVVRACSTDADCLQYTKCTGGACL
jgi:hypothetical protein